MLPKLLRMVLRSFPTMYVFIQSGRQVVDATLGQFFNEVKLVLIQFPFSSKCCLTNIKEDYSFSILPIAEKSDWFKSSQRALHKQPCLGFELGSSILFSATITIWLNSSIQVQSLHILVIFLPFSLRFILENSFIITKSRTDPTVTIKIFLAIDIGYHE